MPIIMYKRDVFTTNELLHLAVSVQNYMEMLFVCGGLRPSRGTWFCLFDTVCKYGICLLKYVGLLCTKLTLCVL